MLIVEFILDPAAVWREHLVPGFCSRPKPKYQIQVKILCFMKPLRMSLSAWRCPPCPDPADCSVSQHLNPGIVDVRQISTGNSPQWLCFTIWKLILKKPWLGQEPESHQRSLYYLSVWFQSSCDLQSQVPCLQSTTLVFTYGECKEKNYKWTCILNYLWGPLSSQKLKFHLTTM